jgi:hypothetical protein
LIDRRHLLAVAWALTLATAAFPVRTALAEDVLSPLAVTPIASPNPVLGADNRMHLAYEIVLMNIGSTEIDIEKIEALNADGGAVLGTLDGAALAKMLRLNGDAKGTALPGGASGMVFLDVTLAKDAAPPKALKHRFEIAVAKALAKSADGDLDPAPAPKQEISFVTDPLQLGPPAEILAPPLKGSRWVRWMLHAIHLPSRRHAAHQRRDPHRRAVRHRLRAVERQEHASLGSHRSAFELRLFRR